MRSATSPQDVSEGGCKCMTDYTCLCGSSIGERNSVCTPLGLNPLGIVAELSVVELLWDPVIPIALGPKDLEW